MPSTTQGGFVKPLWTRDFISAFVANFLMAFAFYLLMPTLPLYLASVLGLSKTAVGVVMSVYVIAALAMRPLSGFLIDALPRKALYVASFACFLLVSLGYPLAATMTGFFVLRLLHGLVWGVITTSGNTLAIDIVPSERRGEGIGYYGMSMNIAMALGPMTGLMLLERVPFLYVFYVSIASSALGLLLSFAIRVPPRARQVHQVFSLDRFLLLRGIPAGVALLCVTVSYGVILAYVAMYGKDHGIGSTGLFFVVMAVAVIAARLLTGRFLDRGYCLQVAWMGALGVAASLLLLGLYPVALCYFLVALSLGLGYGMVFPAVQTLIVGLGDHHQRGTANSTFFTAFDLGVGIGMLFGGRIAQSMGLSAVFVLVAGASLLGAVLLWLQVKKPAKNLA